ncbi:MAG TPA: ABC transporter permease [Flavipsychrobacter sp.]|nr:ABC transporter permease [Flavipsychrobacter sp.]
MRKILATIIKEFILLKRDVAGMALLIIMPAILIIVMALVQEEPFKEYQELRFDLLLANNDHGSVAQEIIAGLKQSKSFHVIDSLNRQPLSSEQMKILLQKGSYKIGIEIPAGVTAEMVNLSNTVANNISKKFGADAILPTRKPRDSNYIRMYFDPVTKQSFRASISFALDKYVTYASSASLMKRLEKLGKAADTSVDTNSFQKVLQGVGIREEPLNNNGKDLVYINSVQHNVPAWAIFGMFFIVVPISGHMIREREGGSALRVTLIPNVQQYVSIGGILFYTIVCTVQFILMLCIGIWFMPVINLPALYLGVHPWDLLPIGISIAFAATAYGCFIGSLFKTANQALPFGSISIVILAALGGIWIPTDLLPIVIQRIALISPLHWGLAAVDQIILRDGNIISVLGYMGVLIGFGILLWLISIFLNNRQQQSVQ